MPEVLCRMGRLMRTVLDRVRMKVRLCTPGSGGQSTQGSAGNEQRANPRGGGLRAEAGVWTASCRVFSNFATTPPYALKNTDDFLLESVY